MKNAWPVFLFFFYLKSSTSAIKCNPDDNCLCLPGQEYEFQCPQDYQDDGFIIHIRDEKQILIDCGNNLNHFDLNLLPNITIDRIEKFRMRFCPIPQNGFKEIIDRFSIKEVKSLQYASSNSSVVTLTKDYFKGLESLESLILDNNALVELVEDVFANTPNLLSLDLQSNHLKLKSNLFKYTSKLKFLDLSQNNLESIPNGLFLNLQNLEVLHLWGNELQEIDEFTFYGLINLKSLELSSNKINVISENALNNLSNLESINMSKNNLKTLPGDLFAYNKKLQLSFMTNNWFLKLPHQLYANLTDLREVDISNCHIDTIPDDIFENSVNIKYLKLERNLLRNIPDNLFQGLVKLEKLSLSHNKIETFDKPFANLSNLKILHLGNNRITEISEDVFKDLTDLEEIYLQSNQIQNISHRAFYTNDNLKKIDLSNNLYSGNTNSLMKLLENANNLENVDLSHNLIEHIDDVINMYNKVQLTSLDLSYNRLTYINVKDLQPFREKLTVNLKYNNITTINFTLVDLITQDVKDAYSINYQPSTVIYLGHNPIECDCSNYDLVKYFKNEMNPQVKVMFEIKSDDLNCATPPKLEHFPIEDLPTRALVCTFEKLSIDNSCPKSCSCFWRPFDKSVIMNCSNRGFLEYPEIDLSQMSFLGFDQIEMHLENNRLTEGPDKNLTNYENITRLYLSNNEIEKVSWFPSRLETLHLDNNKIETLHYKILENFNKSSMINLTLDHNPWECECGAVNLANFLRQQPKTVYAGNVRCSNTTQRLIDLNRNDLCHEWEMVHLLLIVFILVLPVTIFLALFYRYQIEIKVWLFAHNLCLFWVTEEELDKDKIYDAFISYSHKDEDFVVENLLPVLEGGPDPYKLCLHYRNWIPGEFITTQVANSVLESRRTLVVLSKNFLESVWGTMEFRTAHTQAMSEGRARVIIVLYGDIDTEKLDDELKTYLKTNTYVKWGDPYFWNKLKYALPHSKRSISNNNQKIANVMSCIDDKFNLVRPVTSNPASTPPVLALDADALNKHPLKFVSSQETETPPAEAGNLLVSTGL